MVSGSLLFIFGAAGAAAAELLNMRGLFQDDRRRWNREKRQPAFWLLVLAFCAAGGTIAVAHGFRTGLTPILALNIGFTWPLLLRRGASALPSPDLGPTD